MIDLKTRGVSARIVEFATQAVSRRAGAGGAAILVLLLSAVSFTAIGQEIIGQPIGGEAYHIGPEDVLEISVWKEEGLEREVLVRPDGGVSFPLAGNIQVAGKTPADVENEITSKIRKYIPDAVVTVSVVKVSGYSIFVIGKVNNPGQFVVGRYVDVIQALTLAGGLTPYAAENKINVLRRENGGEKVFRFKYSNVKSGKNLKQNILLKSGDVVVVP